MSINQTQAGKNESLPASVKGASEVQSTGASFVVSTGSKAIHKTAVGERSLDRNKKQKQSDFMQQELPHRMVPKFKHQGYF